MRRFLIYILLVMFVSCKSYLDRGKNIHTDFMDFNYLENYNQFIYKSKSKF